MDMKIPSVKLAVPIKSSTDGFSWSTSGALTRWTKMDAKRPLAAHRPMAVPRIMVGKTSAVTTDRADQLKTRQEWKMHAANRTAHERSVKMVRQPKQARDIVVPTKAHVSRKVRPTLSMMTPARRTPGTLAMEKRKAME